MPRGIPRSAGVPWAAGRPTSTAASPSPVMAPDIIVPTLAIPGDCVCTWSVIRPGPGLLCLSQLRYVNALCPVRHQAARHDDA